MAGIDPEPEEPAALTAVKGEREELALCKEALDSAALVIATLDRDLRVVWSSRPALGDKGLVLAEGEPVGGDDPAARALADLLAVALREEQRQRAELELPCDHGPACFDIVVELRRTEAGEVEGLRLVAVEVTDRRRIRERLAELQGDYLGVVMHDLRSPLNVINLAAYAVRGALERQDMDRLTELADKVRKNVSFMTAALDEVLQMGKVESGVALERRTVALREVVEEGLEIGLKPQKRARVQLEEGGAEVQAFVDPPRLQRAVLKLVENALRCSPETDPVVVTVFGTDERALVSVKDHGPRLSPEEAREAFDRYHSTSHERTTGIAGLGLYACRLVVEAHGGACRAEADEHTGGTFVIDLPAAG